MSPLGQVTRNARGLRRAFARGQWRNRPHFLRGLIRALHKPRGSTVDRLGDFAPVPFPAE